MHAVTCEHQSRAPMPDHEVCHAFGTPFMAGSKFWVWGCGRVGPPPAMCLPPTLCPLTLLLARVVSEWRGLVPVRATFARFLDMCSRSPSSDVACCNPTTCTRVRNRFMSAYVFGRPAQSL